MTRCLSVITALAIIFSLCGCGAVHRVRLTLEPETYTASEDMERTAKILEERALSGMFPEFYGFECVKLGGYIQVDMRIKAKGENKAPSTALKKAKSGFKTYWLTAELADGTEVFSSKNIQSVFFDNSTESSPLIIKLDQKGTASFERATINHQKEKLIISLNDLTIGEYTLELWSNNGTLTLFTDAQYSEKEQNKLKRHIESSAGLSGKYKIVGKEVF